MMPRRLANTLRIGVPRHLLEKGIDADVSAAFEEVLRELECGRGHDDR